MRFRLPLALALVLGACGGGAGADDEVTVSPTPVPTVAGVGRLPDTVPEDERSVTTTEPLVVVTRPVDEDTGALLAPIAEQVAGNRLLVIGDSIMASTASRFGGEMCEELAPLGWATAVEAEPGRFVGFGLRVLDRLLPDEPNPDPSEDWDAAAVHLGSNYDGDQEMFFSDLARVLDRLAPRPTLLFTVTEFRPSWSEANAVIRALADAFDHVTLIDWEKAARTPGVLSGDGLHPGDAGEQVLVELTSAALGSFTGVDGDCLRAQFTDDSAIGRGGGTPNGSSSSTGGGSSSSTSGGSSSSSTGGSTTTTGGSTTGSDSTGGSDTTGTDTTGGSDTTGSDSTGGSDTTGTDTTGGSDTTGTDTTGGSDTTGTDTTGGSDTTGTDTTGGSDTTGTDTTGGSDTTGTTGTTGGSDTTGTTGTTGGSDTTGTTGGSTTGTTGGTTSGTTGTTGTTGATTSGTSGTTGGSTTGTTGATTTGSTGGTTGGDAATSTTGDP
jgi:hypothetical protein